MLGFSVLYINLNMFGGSKEDEQKIKPSGAE